MPYELVVQSPKVVTFAEYQDRNPVGSEVLVQTTVSGIKRGTELNIYRGTLPFATELWNAELRPFRPPRPDEQIKPFFPHTMGSWAAGVVRKVVPDARRFKPGDLVHGEWRHRQSITRPEDALYAIPAQVDDETMVFSARRASRWQRFMTRRSRWATAWPSLAWEQLA